MPGGWKWARKVVVVVRSVGYGEERLVCVRNVG